MKIFEKLRIIEAGETANYYEEGGKTYKLVISASAFPSLVALGNSRPIHARRTHNGTDLLDGYIGHFTNFTHDENAVYADLVMSEALESAYPSEYNFMVAMIEKEPELLGVSVNQSDVKQLDEEAQTATVTEVRELFSADLVGLPAATSSLFNNNLNKLSMSKFWTKLAELVKSTKLARETVTTKEGKELVIIAQGEQAALGDEVQDAEGKPVEDGDYYISIGEGEDMIISVVAGKISDVKEVESEAKREEEGQEEKFATEEKPEGGKEDEDKKKTATPEELAAIRKEVTELKKTVSDLKTQLSKRTGTPPAAKTELKTETKTETKLSREEVQKAAAEMRKKFKY
nr:MAG: Prohead core protein serine protease [Bacteriophage sp.]